MPRANNFHPEWGCLAPAAGFVRTARVAFVATTIGATVGASVVLSLLAYPTTESTVSARTLVRLAESASRPQGPAEADKQPVLNQPQFPFPQIDANQTAHATTNRPRASVTTKAVERFVVSTGSATPADDTLAARPVAVVGLPTRDPTPTNMKSTKKLNISWRNASHREPLKSPARRETRAQGGSPNVESQGGWSDWDGGWPDQGTTSRQGSPGGFLLGLGRIVTQVFGQSSP